MTSHTFSMPYPPSLNNLFANVPGRGRVRAKRYRVWANAAGWELKEQGPLPRMKGPVGVRVELTPPDRRKRDLDNVGTKAVLDLLTELEVIEDDSLVEEIFMRWCRNGNKAGAQVSIYTMDTTGTLGAGRAA